MSGGIKMIWLALAFGALAMVSTGCTSAWYDKNRAYAKESREFQRKNQRLSGTYLGVDDCDGVLCEIYQFESPFRRGTDHRLLEVLIPVYGVNETDRIQVFETDQLEPGDQVAELWFWDSEKSSRASWGTLRSDRRIDLVWQGDGKCTVIRRIAKEKTVRKDQWDSDLKIPWNKRSRLTYTMRHMAYAGTVSADIAAGAGIAVAGAGYVTLLACIHCPCLVVAIIEATN